MNGEQFKYIKAVYSIEDNIEQLKKTFRSQISNKIRDLENKADLFLFASSQTLLTYNFIDILQFY